MITSCPLSLYGRYATILLSIVANSKIRINSSTQTKRMIKIYSYLRRESRDV